MDRCFELVELSSFTENDGRSDDDEYNVFTNIPGRDFRPIADGSDRPLVRRQPDELVAGPVRGSRNLYSCITTASDRFGPRFRRWIGNISLYNVGVLLVAVLAIMLTAACCSRSSRRSRRQTPSPSSLEMGAEQQDLIPNQRLDDVNVTREEDGGRRGADLRPSWVESSPDGPDDRPRRPT